MNSILTTPENRELVASFTVHGEPISKSRARFTKRGSKMVSYTPQKTMDGEKAIAAAFLAETKRRSVDAEATYAVYAHFINGTRQRRDVDNMVKLILDGLNDVAWPDDNQVTEIAARKSFGLKVEARTEVQIFRIGAMNRPCRACPQCGGDVRVYDSTPTRAFCSMECMSRSRAASRMCVCKNCGIEFDGQQQTRKPTYCSMSCKSADMTVDVACKQCNKAFRRPRSQSSGANHFCSTDCRETHDLICVHGHHWAEFLKRRANGSRYCSECNRIRAQASYLAKSAHLIGPDLRQGGKGELGVTITITEEEQA